MKGETWKIILAVLLILGGLFLFWESEYSEEGLFVEQPRSETTTTTIQQTEKNEGEKEFSSSSDETLDQREAKEERATSSLPQSGEEPAGTSTSTKEQCPVFTKDKDSPRTEQCSVPTDDKDSSRTPPREGAVPTEKENDTGTETKERNIQEELPFTPQAPFANWEDKRHQEGCEEASVLMAIYAVKGRELSPSIAKEKILDMAHFQKENYDTFVDTAVEDTAFRLIEDYFGYPNYEIKKDIGKKDIIEAVEVGHLVIIPLNGRTLDNPYYSPPGPDRHNLVIRGYDKESEEFITNDPGTKRGENFRYSVEDLYSSIRDYPTGDDRPIEEVEKNMIVIK